MDLYYLDMADLENGKATVLQKSATQITGNAGATIMFRQTFTPDGKYLLQSGADTFYLIDAETLSVVDKETMNDGANHDAVPTPDGKYALLTIRVADSQGMAVDGQVQLYDIEAKSVVGAPASVCAGCHPSGTTAVLCGLDAVWN